eukprot:6213511-Pleurochrysis_carterae.AAC.4
MNAYYISRANGVSSVWNGALDFLLERPASLSCPGGASPIAHHPRDSGLIGLSASSDDALAISDANNPINERSVGTAIPNHV